MPDIVRNRSDLLTNTFRPGPRSIGQEVSIQDIRDLVVSVGTFPSVKDYGAIGDGVTDDTAAIVAAFAVGGTIFFPEGIYKISVTAGPLVIKSGTKLIGAGSARSIIKPYGTNALFALFGNTNYIPYFSTPNVHVTPSVQTDVDMGMEGLGFDCSSFANYLVRYMFARNIVIRDIRATNGITPPTATTFGFVGLIGCDNVTISDVWAENVENFIDIWRGSTRIKIINVHAELAQGAANGGAFNFNGSGDILDSEEHQSDYQITNASIWLNGGCAFFLDSLGAGCITSDVLITNTIITAKTGTGNSAIVGRGLGGRISARSISLVASPGAVWGTPFLIGAYYSSVAANNGTNLITTTNASSTIVLSVTATDLGPGNIFFIDDGAGGPVVGRGLSISGAYVITAVSGGGTSVSVNAGANATSSGTISATTHLQGYIGAFADCDFRGVMIDGAQAAGSDIFSLTGSGHQVDGVTVTQNYGTGFSTPQYRSVVSVDPYYDFLGNRRASMITNIVAAPGTGSLAAGFIGNHLITFDMNFLAPYIGPTQFAPLPAAQLPTVTSADAGKTVWVTNARQTGEGAGVGTGALCYVDNTGVWKATWSGAAPTT